MGPAADPGGTAVSSAEKRDLRGRVAVVTGGSKGIGLGTVEALANAGAQVMAGSRTVGEGLSALLCEDVRAHAGDLSEPGGCERLVAEAEKAFGGVDVLVNNVGGLSAPRFDGFLGIDDRTWAATLDLNLLSTVRACRAAIPLMLDREAGAIVNVASANGWKADPIVLDYGTSKAAVLHLTKELALEFGDRGIRVNSVSPGSIWTHAYHDEGRWLDLVQERLGVSKDDVVEEIPAAAGITLGRLGRVDEIAEAILFLASPAASYVTGTDLVVDGGILKEL